jgi:hypothetical protein
MDQQKATAQLRLVRAPHVPVPSVASIWDGTPRCARDGVRVHPVKGRKRSYWRHDSGEIGALAAAADHGFPKVR